MIVMLLNIYVIHHFSHLIDWCSISLGIMRIRINLITRLLKEGMLMVKIHLKLDLLIRFLCLLRWVWLQLLALFMDLLIVILVIHKPSFIKKKKQEIMLLILLKKRIVFWILLGLRRLNFYKDLLLLLNDRLFIDKILIALLNWRMILR